MQFRVHDLTMFVDYRSTCCSVFYSHETFLDHNFIIWAGVYEGDILSELLGVDGALSNFSSMNKCKSFVLDILCVRMQKYCSLFIYQMVVVTAAN